MSRPEDFLNMLYEPDEWTDGQWSSDPPIGISFPFLPSDVNADTQAGLTSPTPAGRNVFTGTDRNSLYHGYQHQAQPPIPDASHQSFGNSNHSYPTINHQDRVSRVYQGQLPDRGAYESDETYGVKPQNQVPQAPQVYKSESPTPAPSDHNFGVNDQAIKSIDLPSPAKGSGNGDKDEYDFDSQWMSEIDPKVLDITSSDCTSQIEI
jgi:hypothetical protein